MSIASGRCLPPPAILAGFFLSGILSEAATAEFARETQIEAGSDNVNAVAFSRDAFSSDEKMLTSGSDDHTVVLWVDGGAPKN